MADQAPQRRNDHHLSRHQKRALVLLEAAGGEGVVSAGSTTLLDGQPWIHWRTAYSLHDSGLAWVSGRGDEVKIVLT